MVLAGVEEGAGIAPLLVVVVVPRWREEVGEGKRPGAGEDLGPWVVGVMVGAATTGGMKAAATGAGTMRRGCIDAAAFGDARATGGVKEWADCAIGTRGPAGGHDRRTSGANR
jgi:hypothetical protein